MSDTFLIENDVLDRINNLLEYKHWSVYKLAKESGLPYSSLSNIFNRKTTPTISTLEKICCGLNISMSEFFEYKTVPLRAESLDTAEQYIVNAYRTLSTKDQELLTAYLDGLCKR